jgi:hypothetical protein
MTKSRFWRNLAKMFRALQVNSRMRAEWHYIVGSGPREWTLTDASGIARIRFEALARSGAAALSDTGGSDLLVVWLEALRLARENSGFIMERFGYEQNAEGTERADHQNGIIFRVCEASVNYCSELGSRAGEAELRKKLQAREDESNASEVVDSGESLGHQINQLRKESRMTVEELADRMKFNARTVQHHIADTRRPLGRNLRGYERIFSKSLQRKIVIKKMP